VQIRFDGYEKSQLTSAAAACKRAISQDVIDQALPKSRKYCAVIEKVLVSLLTNSSMQLPIGICNCTLGVA
jgi:hypothetical protein